MSEWKEGVSDAFHREILAALMGLTGLAILLIAVFYPHVAGAL